MVITQNLVEVLNARLKDLAVEVSMFNAVELGEDMELEGINVVSESLASKLSSRFGNDMSDSEEFFQALEALKNQLRVTIQLDHLAADFKSIGASEVLLNEMKELKEVNLKSLMNVLQVEESEVE